VVGGSRPGLPLDLLVANRSTLGPDKIAPVA